MRCSAFRSQCSARPVHRPTSAARSLSLNVRAELAYRGKAVPPEFISVGKILGEGSFGQVFEGAMTSAKGNAERVVLKRVKVRVEGAVEFGRTELLLNAYAAKVAKGFCADFVGYCEVSKDESTARLTSGLCATSNAQATNQVCKDLQQLAGSQEGCHTAHTPHAVDNYNDDDG
eukprot:gene832-33563_t